MLIKIKNLKLKTVIGIHEWESAIDRQIIINIEIETDHEKSLSSDEISDAIDYDSIVSKIKDLISKNRYKLVEKMAQEIAELIMKDFRVKRCNLELDKVGAIEGLESFAVVIEKRRSV
jgi:dihydroneopterin aldolase